MTFKGREISVDLKWSTNALPCCTVRPIKTAALSLSVHPLLDQYLLHLYPTHRSDLIKYLPQTPARGGSYQGTVRGCPSAGFPGN